MQRNDAFTIALYTAGALVCMAGLFLLGRIYLYEPRISYPFVITLFLIIFLILLLVLAHSNYTVKKEVAQLLLDHKKEMTALREINEEKLLELKAIKKRR